MKTRTLTAYIGNRGSGAVEMSNKYPDFATNVRKVYWCEDFKSMPSISEASEANYDEAERYSDANKIEKVFLNHCR